jgi:hypothetical protein
MRQPEPLPTIKEKDASCYLGMSVAWLRQCRMRGRGPKYLQLGRAVRYRVQDLNEYLAAHVVTPHDGQAQ